MGYGAPAITQAAAPDFTQPNLDALQVEVVDPADMEPTADRDGDRVYLDPDSDNAGITDGDASPEAVFEENPFGTNLDSDSDGVPDYIDIDDDNDGLQDDLECSISNEGQLLSIVNGSFEEPNIQESADLFSQHWGSLPTVAVTFYEQDIPNWTTTASDNRIEMWASGFYGVQSYDGTQHAEINANMYAGLYVDVETTPGDDMIWGFAHRGRSGTDTIGLFIGPAGGDLVKVGEFSSTQYGWNTFEGHYIVPKGQTNTRFEYRALHAAGNLSVGNFLDGIYFKSTACKVDTDGDGIVNSLDLDSDGDGKTDVIEAGGNDSDRDGRIDPFVDKNKDGFNDPLVADPLPNPDTDVDDLPDVIDAKDDREEAQPIPSFGAPPAPNFPALTCDGTIYQIANDRIYTVDASDSNVSTDKIFLQYKNSMNALGHNPADNYMYALGSKGEILQIGANGQYRDIGKVAGISKKYPVGSFLADGTYIVGNSGGPFYHIDLSKMEIIKTVKAQTRVSFQDFAVSPIDGLVYAKDSRNGQLLTIDMNTGAVNHIGYAYSANSGAVWFDSAGNFYAYSLTHRQYFRMDAETGKAIVVGTGPQLSNIDATSCAYGLELYLDIDDVPVYQDDVELNVSTFNSSAVAIDNVTYTQTLPEGFAFPSGAKDEIERAFMAVYGSGVRVRIEGVTLTITGMRVPQQEAGASFTINQAGNDKDQVDFQGEMTNLPTILGGEMVTDDPTTGPTPDPTRVNFSVPNVPYVTCSSDPFVFNTGYDLNGGKLPSGWSDRGWMSAVGTADGDPDDYIYDPAFVANPPDPSWPMSPYGNAGWISNWSDSQHAPAPQDVFYRYQFYIAPDVDLGTFRLKVDIYADNNIYEIYVNGDPVSGFTQAIPQFGESYTSPGYQAAGKATLTLKSNWQHGLNTIVLQNRSSLSPEGVMVQMTADQVCFSEPPEVACPADYTLLDYFVGDAFQNRIDTFSGEMPFDGTLLLQGWVKEGHPEVGCSTAGGSAENPMCTQYQNNENFDIQIEQWDIETTFATYRDNLGGGGLQNYYFEEGPYTLTVDEGDFELAISHAGPNTGHSVGYNYAVCAGDPLPVRDISIEVAVPEQIAPTQTFGQSGVGFWTYTVKNESETMDASSVTFTDTFSPGLEDSGSFELSISQPDDWTCEAPNFEEGTLTCTANKDLPPGYMATFLVSGATVPRDFEGDQVTHEAVISSTPADRPNRQANNTATAATAIIQADLQLEVETDAAAYQLEETATFTVTVTNDTNIPEWQNDVEQPVVRIDLPDVDTVDYYSVETTTYNNWWCSHDIDANQLVCQKAGSEQVTHGTIDEQVVSFQIIPRGNYLFDQLSVSANATSDTFDPREENNTVVHAIAIDRIWEMPAGYEYQINPFAHLKFDESFVEDPEGKAYNLERDIPLTEWTTTPLQVPLQTTFGISLTTKPTLVVNHCLGDPLSSECIDTRAVITGTAIVSSFTIDTFERIDDNMQPVQDHSPDTPIQINLGIDEQNGRYVSEDLDDCRSEEAVDEFESEIDCIVSHEQGIEIANQTPGLYATTFKWQAPEYLTLALKTKGGRDLTIPQAGGTIQVEDAKPGVYRIEGSMAIQLRFEDVRLSQVETVDVTYPVVLYIEVIAPFQEGEGPGSIDS